MAVTINQTTGAVTAGATTATERQAITAVQMVVRWNSKEGSRVATVYQTGAEAPYLYVTPTEVQWVTVDMGADYDVKSNTDWNAL